MSLQEDILIENYLKDILSESEKKDFNERMQNDAAFKEKVLFEKKLSKTLDQNDWSFVESDKSNDIKDVEEVFKSEEVQEIKKSILIAQNEFKKSQKNNKNIIYLAVASIALLFSAYSLFVTVNKPYTSSELYAKYINSTELYSSVSRGSNESQKKLIIAESYFREEKYFEALPIFKKILNSEKDNAQLYIYTAISQIELNKFREAEAVLNNLIKTDLIDAEKGYWYKSLLYLKMNKLSETKSELQFIIENDYFKSKEAKELLSKINN